MGRDRKHLSRSLEWLWSLRAPRALRQGRRAPSEAIRSLLARSLFVLLAIESAAACSSDSGGGGPAEPEVRTDSVVDIQLDDFFFSIPNLAINAGTRVRWVPVTAGHTVTPDGHSEWQRWAVNTLADTLEHVFDEPGEFPYFCEPHLSRGMTGVITVN